MNPNCGGHGARGGRQRSDLMKMYEQHEETAMHMADTRIFSDIGISLSTISHVRKLLLVRRECPNRR